MLKQFEEDLKKNANPEKAKNLQRFFKTGKGEYGEGDVFLGISVPNQREIAKTFKDLDIKEIQELLDSVIHEKRLIGLLILIEQFKKARKERDNEREKQIFDFYLDNAKRNKINNWDLVDLSAPNIVGNHLIDKNREILYQLALSDNLWEKRVSAIACFSFIRNNDFKDGIEISKILLGDSHDLIHKAVGWMLREIGKKDEAILESFLKENYTVMPRTMLRYAIEKMEYNKRQRYLKGEI